MIRFGPSGNSDSFYEQGNKESLQMPKWLSGLGLNAYEYSCTKGVRLKAEKAEKLGEEAKKHEIALSVHAPYYINLATDDEKKRQNSITYIIDTLRLADVMGATRIVVHSGACAKLSRETALENAKTTLAMAVREADNLHLGHVHICPETMGKINQLGTLEEVMELCLLDERLIPTIDFGHLYARSFGALTSVSDYELILDTIGNKLGTERMKGFHCHFSKIEYTSTGGEKRHLIFSDPGYGPDFEPLAGLLYHKNLEPVIICESAGTMAEAALYMKNLYENVKES